MSEGPGQQPPQEPRNQASDGPREVLEGRVIPSRTSEADPRRGFAAPPQHARPRPEADPGPEDPAAAPPEGAFPDGPYAFRPGQPGVPGPRGRRTPTQAAPSAQGPSAPGPAQGQDPAQGGRPGQQAGGYGFPQQQQQPPPGPAVPGTPGGAAAPGAPGPGPAQGGYGFPRQEAPGAGTGRGPGGPGAPGGPTGPSGPAGPAGRGPGTPGPAAARGASPVPGTPDWSALAEEQASGARRRRIMMLVGGGVAVAVIAGGVATAVVMSGRSSDHTIADPTASSSSTASEKPLPPEPSFSSVAPPPPANPLDFISSAAKDTAPLTPASLFPGKQFVLQGRTYTKTNSAVTTTCSAAAGAPLSGALASNGCTKLVRVTYTNGKIAVTVGVAVFADKAHAAKLHNVAQYIAPLNGGGVADFCHAVACQMTSNSVGRYAYFAISGFKNGQTLKQGNTTGEQAANDASDFAFQRIVQRGRDAAQAQANSQ
ncbi:hypothetical protein [Actinacidiphila yanglinensis]|nr:hypothetical protein [Actinacidiphila yanglinensis]